MRSTSCSAQHFKSDKELFLESCHPFKAELMADQHFDRADMCPSAVAEPLGYTFFPPGIVALKYRTCLLADLTLVKAHKGGGGCGSAAWQVAIDGWRRDLRYRLHNASNRDSTALTLEGLRIASRVPVAFDPKRTSLTFVHIRRREWATASSKRSRPKPRRCLGATRFSRDRSPFPWALPLCIRSNSRALTQINRKLWAVNFFCDVVGLFH